MDVPLAKRQRIKQQNRQSILDAARRVFAERGYDAATVRDIIRATPLAAGTFYNYFTSKEEVRRALKEEMAEIVRPRLKDGREEASTAEEFLSAFFSSVFALKTEAGLTVEADDLQSGFEDLAADLEDAAARGLFLPLDGRAFAAALLAAADAFAARLARDGGDAAQATQEATTLFLRGVQPPP
jgi:AcrR family transcriptional regulator